MAERRVKTGDRVVYHGQQYYAKANGSSVRLFAKPEHIGDHSKQVFAPATKNVQIVSQPQPAARSLPARSASARAPVAHPSVTYHPAPVPPPPAASYLHGAMQAVAAQQQRAQAEAARQSAIRRQQEEELQRHEQALRQEQIAHLEDLRRQQERERVEVALRQEQLAREQQEYDQLHRALAESALREGALWAAQPQPAVTLRPPPAAAAPPSQPAATSFIPASMLVYDAQPLAVGAFGKVFRAVHRATGQVFAAKQRSVSDAELDEEARADFAAEVAVLRSLNHPNVLRFIGTSEVPATGEIVLLTEFMEGGALSDWIYKRRGGPTFSFTDRQRITLAVDIASGLAFIHGQNVLHRDIKSDNVLLDKDGERAKISDLGLAKVRSSSSYYASGYVGTLIYMAPEILNKAKYSAAADVYSFALVLYELYTGKRPYPTKYSADQELLRHEVVTLGKRPKLEGFSFPHEIVSVMQECWQADHRARPKMSAEVKGVRGLL